MTDFTPEQRRHAVAMWNEGADTLAIATAFGCDEAVIYNDLPRWRHECKWRRNRTLQGKAAAGRKITARHKRQIPPEHEADYRLFRRKGFRAHEAAKMLGLA